MASSLFISDPAYSLQQSNKYPIERITQNLKVPYYVKENFHTEYQGSLRRLEVSVEEDYIANLRHACYREKNYRKCFSYIYFILFSILEEIFNTIKSVFLYCMF